MACSREEPPRPRNVIFILVDTLRADHLGAYGYSRPTSPALDAFARESVLFQNARSQAACTFPSVNSLLTSRYPPVFLGQPGQALGIPASVPSLAEVLQARGYTTVAVSASAVVRNTPSRHNPGGGFGRGFDLFLEDCLWKSASCVNRQAFGHLQRRGGGDKPLFLYLHYLDPHGPYAPPSTYKRQFAGGGEPERAFIRNGNPNPIGDWLYKQAPDPAVTPRELQHLVDLYDDEIAFWDAEFARLLARIEEAGLLEDSILVIASDHGEEFLEHGHIKHCRNLFDTTVRTPLILRIPGVEPKQVAAAVENLDIVPTLLDYLGIETVGLTLEGRSLRPLIEGGEEPEPAAERRQYATQGPWRGVSDGRYKLIHDLANGGFALYDLSADPGETRDVLRDQRRTFHRLRQDLTAWLGRAEGEWAASESVRKAQEAEKKLRSLGYLE